MCSVLEGKHEHVCQTVASLKLTTECPLSKSLLEEYRQLFARITKQTSHLTCISGIHKFSVIALKLFQSSISQTFLNIVFH